MSRRITLGLLLALGLSLASSPALAGKKKKRPSRNTYTDQFVVTQYGDSRGGDLDIKPARSIAECKRACVANASCRAFTYNDGERKCWIKGAPGKKMRHLNLTDVRKKRKVYYGLRLKKGASTRLNTLRRNWTHSSDRPNNDIRRIEQVPSRDICFAMCANHRECKAVTYESISFAGKTTVKRGFCWLKNSVGRPKGAKSNKGTSRL